jgi:hypothetical protein
MTLLATSALAPAHAHMSGVPDAIAPTGTGAMASAEYGDPGDGYATGIGVGGGFGRFGGRLDYAHRDFDGEEGDSVGGSAGMNLFGLGPATLGAQVGVSSIDHSLGRQVAILPGVSAKGSIPGIPLKPWGLLTYRIGDNLSDEFRFTLGADWNFMPSFGAHAGVEWGESGNVYGVGAHVAIGVPGL